MLFAIGVMLALFAFTRSLLDLGLATALILIRGGYLRREIRLVSIFALVVAIIAFVAPLVGPAYKALADPALAVPPSLFQEAAMLAGRVLVSVLLVQNIAGDPTVGASGHFALRPFPRAAVLAQLLIRGPGEVARRSSDVIYALRLRLRQPEVTLWQRIKLVVYTAVALSVEFVTMSNEVAVAIGSKGKLPKLGLWKTVPRGVGPVLTADAIFLVTIILLGKSSTEPDWEAFAAMAANYFGR